MQHIRSVENMQGIKVIRLACSSTTNARQCPALISRTEISRTDGGGRDNDIVDKLNCPSLNKDDKL